MATEAVGQKSDRERSTNGSFHLGHRPGLDGLRGWAVLVVLAGHLKLPLAEHGALGVDVFFSLSGFLISVLLAEEWQRQGGIRFGRFYLRRVLRLYPALLLMLLAVSFVSPARDYLLSALTYTTNWVIALKIRPLNLELGHTWTLAIEEQYYLLWPPLLAFLLRRFSPRKVVLFPIGLALLSYLLRVISWTTTHDFWRYNAGADTHADGLLLGSALGLATAFGLLPRGEAWRKALRAATLPALGWVAWVTVIDPAPAGWIACGGISLVVVATLLVIIQVVHDPWRPVLRVLEFAPLARAGMVSYGLYLWQVPVLVLLNMENIGLTAGEAMGAKVMLIFALVLLSYRYVERPILRLKDRIETRPKKRSLVRQGEPAGKYLCN